MWKLLGIWNRLINSVYSISDGVIVLENQHPHPSAAVGNDIAYGLVVSSSVYGLVVSSSAYGLVLSSNADWLVGSSAYGLVVHLRGSLIPLFI